MQFFLLPFLFLTLSTSPKAQSVTWEQVGAPASFDDLHFDSADTLWIPGGVDIEPGGVERGLHYVEPGGSEVLLRLEDIDGAPPGRFITLTKEEYFLISPVVYRSTDRGRSFEEVHPSGGNLYLVEDGPHDGLLLTTYTDFDETGASYSTDSGATWTDVEIDPDGTSFGQALDFVSIPEGPHAGRVIAACMNGLAYSDDGGVSWVLSDTWEPFRYRVESVMRLPTGRLFAGAMDEVASSSVYTSDDSGETWQRLRDFGRQVGAAHLRYVGEDRLFALMDGAGVPVWRSDDAGQTWEELTPVEAFAKDNVSLRGLAVGPEGRLWATVYGGGLIEPTDGLYRTVEAVTVSTEQEVLLQAFELDAVYPNPATGNVTVAVTLDRSAAVRLTVFDVLGREVGTFYNGVLGAGGHALSLDTSALPSGVYVVHLTAAGQAATQRLTVMR